MDQWVQRRLQVEQIRMQEQIRMPGWRMADNSNSIQSIHKLRYSDVGYLNPMICGHIPGLDVG
jgi:hypothetical protein